MKETAKALLSKNKNELSAARTLYVSLDRADNVIEGGAGFSEDLRFWVAHPSRCLGRVGISAIFSAPTFGPEFRPSFVLYPMWFC